METKFARDPVLDRQKWACYFHAGNSWLQALHILEDDDSKGGAGVFFYYTNPYILFLCFELFVKSLTSYEDHSFSGESHEVVNIMKVYNREIPIFGEIIKNKKITKLITEYQKTSDTRFGETTAQIDRDDKALMLESIYKMYEEICKKTGLKW